MFTWLHNSPLAMLTPEKYMEYNIHLPFLSFKVKAAVILSEKGVFVGFKLL